MKKILRPKITEKEELFFARLAAAVAIVIAGLFGIYPPAFVAEVVALAFGLAAATIFPALVLGIFTKSVSKEGAIAGMLSGLIFTLGYILWFKFINPQINTLENWVFGISPEGIGIIGMLINFIIACLVSTKSSKCPIEVTILVDNLRSPEN